MWKEHCLNMHGTLCSTAQTETISINLRLIDVEDRCIVEIQRCERWVALSYVWGNANKLVLTSDILGQYQEHGSIKPGVTSATIEDAITVTRILGERYLWVDSLCILQDSEADKELYIPLMGFIYGKALLTIICASGSSAEAGLPGIQVSSRKMQPLVFKTGTTTFMTTLDPEDTEGWSYTTSSAWCTRAWTLQERLFSKRALIFTPELIYWECQKATWREDSFWEVSSSPNFYQACWGDKSFWNHDRLATLWRSDEFNFVDLYRQLVSHYTQLHLSFNEDGLNAIAGIVNDLKRRSGYNFIWALPTPFLSAFLAWEDYSTYEDVIPGRHYRRTAQCNFPNETGISRRCHFPSWSWVGWT
ncbi:HET-domain-containing protein, partial [Hyaloscypha variabilis F]